MRFWIWAFLLLVLPAQARVVRVQVDTTEPFHGSYERLRGKIYFSVPIANPHNQGIVDLSNAINLKDGEVAFSADFIAIRPKKTNGSMLLEVPNRGSAHIFELVNGSDDWLVRQGFTVVTVGWQWDAVGPDALRLYAPIAKDHGKTITGLLRGDFMLSKALPEVPLGHFTEGTIGGSEYPVAAPDDPRNVLTVRPSREAPRTVIPRSQWQFVGDKAIRLNGGFEAGKIYEYVYVVKDPVVAGLGFAAIRDFAAYAKHDSKSITPVARVYGEGISQNGRFLRDFLYQGCNADEEGRIALDGVLAHVAGAGRGSFNFRFAQPSRDARPTTSVFFPTDIFPFTDEPETDPLTGKTAGLLDQAVADKVTPKIFFSNTSYEYWGRVASLISTTADGTHDAAISDNVRIYHFTGLQHFSVPFPPEKGTGDLMGQQPQSPLPVRFFWRAMIANMDAWVRNGTLPPPSNYPRIADGNLVPFSQYAWPAIPGLNLPHEVSQAFRLDFSVVPPRVGPAFPVLVPQVDGDGNERDGVHLPEIIVPLATYVGWNLRDPSIGAPDQRVAFEASYLPFAKTAAEREQKHDPRPSIAERYHDRDDYLARYEKAIDNLVEQRWILPEDKAALLARGEEEWTVSTQ
jgi:hypothetical protein